MLQGPISAGSIDFSNHPNKVTFEGGASADGIRFEAGFETGSLTGSVGLSNDANGVLASAAEGSAPVVNGWNDVYNGTGGALGSTLALLSRGRLGRACGSEFRRPSGGGRRFFTARISSELLAFLRRARHGRA